MIPTTAAPTNPELAISACDSIEGFEFPSVLSTKSSSNLTYMSVYMSVMEDSKVRFKFYYDDSTNSYTITYAGDSTSYLVQIGSSAYCKQTSSITDSYRWIKYDGTTGSTTYSVLQNLSTKSYLIHDSNYNVDVASSISSSQSNKFNIAPKPYKP